MTDLTRERIEEIKKWKSLFDRGEVVNFLSVGETHDLARQLLATMTERDEAQAAQAIAAQCCICGKKGLSTAEDGGPECELHDGRWVCGRKCWEVASDLADPTGVALLAELRARAERAEAELQRFHEERAYVIGANDGWDAAVEQGEASPAVSKAMVRFWKKLADTHNSRAERAEAERDRLAAANAVLEAKVAGLVEALNDISVFLDFRGFNEMEPTPAAKIARAALAAAPTWEESNG